MATTEIVSRPRKPLTGAELVVTIKPTREYYARMWLAVQLFKAAGWLLDCKVTFEGYDK